MKRILGERMKKVWLVGMLMVVATNCYAAELLVRAKPHWMDDFTKNEVDALNFGRRNTYNSRLQIGDIVAVRPDGWQWGKEECLPNFVIVKVPELNIKQAKIYEETLQDNTDPEQPKMLRLRKYALPKSDIETAKINNLNFIGLTKSVFNSKIVTKTGATSEIPHPKTGLISFYLRKVKPYLAIAKTFWLRNAYAATQLKKTVMPSGGDYTSLTACISANVQNLVTADKYFDVEIDGDWSGGADTGDVVISGYTADATRYINIYTTASARHPGKEGSGKYALNGRIYAYDQYTTITGLEIYGVSPCITTAGYAQGSYAVTIDQCICRDTAIRGIAIYDNSYNIVIKNTIVYNVADWGGIDTSARCTIFCYNVTLYKCRGYGFGGDASDGGLTKCVNCIAAGSGIGYYGGNFTTDSAYNVSYDQSAPLKVTIDSGTCDSDTANHLIDSDQNFLTTVKVGMRVRNTTDTTYGYVTAVNSNSDLTLNTDLCPDGNEDYIIYNAFVGTPSFVSTSAGSEDFHLLENDTVAIDMGADLSGTFTDDIDGDTRSGTWDIGADEYVAAVSNYFYGGRSIGAGIGVGIGGN